MLTTFGMTTARTTHAKQHKNKGWKNSRKARKGKLKEERKKKREVCKSNTNKNKKQNKKIISGSSKIFSDTDGGGGGTIAFTIVEIIVFRISSISLRYECKCGIYIIGGTVRNHFPIRQ